MTEIEFSNEPDESLNRFFKMRPYSKVCVLTDTNTQEHCYPKIRSGLPNHRLITIPAGEEHKNLNTCERIWAEMTEEQLDRHSVLVILGGGVCGDMGGFCAATYKRGIDFILVPTTLLAQADASIGGKLGIDFHDLKNHIGVFQEPVLTVIHSGFLDTLPWNEKRSGFAEIIKHALISDKQMWGRINKHTLADQPWQELIRHSVEFKSRIVEADPKEKGLRKILNAGHTLGHAIETYLLSTGKKIMHGEAIAAGLIAESFLSNADNLIADREFSGIKNYILNIFGKLEIAEEDVLPIARLTVQDKKNKGGKILCVFLEEIGKARFDCGINEEQVIRALQYYRSIQM